MKYASDFRGIARQALTNRWGVAIGTGLVAGLLGADGGVSFPNFEGRDIEKAIDSEIGSFVLLFLFGLFGMALIWGLICFFLGGAIKLGYARFNKNLIIGNEVGFNDLFSRFDVFWRGFLMQFLVGLYTFFWLLLFIIPGIIASFSYSMTPYILEENPYMPINEAIYRSKEMMRGNKWRLFCLKISFIGWYIVCIFTCGIGFLWLGPYISAATAAFYFEVSTKFYNQGNPQYNPLS